MGVNSENKTTTRTILGIYESISEVNCLAALQDTLQIARRTIDTNA